KTFVDSPANISEDFDIIELSDSCNAHDQTEKTQTKKSLKMGKSPQKNLTSEGSNFVHHIHQDVNEPSTSRQEPVAGPSTSNENYHHDGSSDTSSAAGFTVQRKESAQTESPIQSNQDNLSYHLHHYPKSLTPEIEPINDSTSIMINSDPNHHQHYQHAIVSPQISTSNASNIDYLLSLLPPTELSVVPLEDPIIIRGNGNMTLFGLSNSFSSTFPSSLLGRVSREEFEYTMNRINHLLRQQHSTNAKFLLLGCLCCCCSLGCSLLWPTFALSKRTRSSLQKLLAMENSRLYNKLGLNWRVTKQQSHTNHSFMEYILVIDFLPKMQIYQPD
ncbi:Cysteine-rich hydrophobic domain-containing protein 2, partial [Blomia tropicalis]